MENKRKIKDAGEVIEGAKKLLRKEALNINILNDMTEEEKTSLVTKDNIWKKPDYKKMLDEGFELQAICLIKIIRDRLASKPSKFVSNGKYDFNQVNHDYVSTMTLIKEYCETHKTVDDIKKLITYIMDKTDYKNRENPNRYTLMWSISNNRSCPLQVFPIDLHKMESMIHAGFPNDDIPVWKKGVNIRQYSNSFCAIKSSKIIARGDSEEELWEKLETAYNKKKEARKKKQDIYDKPHLENLPEPKYTNITPEDFINDFGFRGIQFGEWLPDNERQAVLNISYSALMDLVELYDLTPDMISLNNTLGIAFGARGSGKANAHYEPDQTVLNLTRLRGAGSLVHEWAHALDNFLGKTGHTDKIENLYPRYASGGHQKTNTRLDALPLLPEELRNNIENIMEAIYYKDMTTEELNEQINKIEKLREYNLKLVEKKIKTRGLNPILQKKIDHINDYCNNELKTISKYSPKTNYYETSKQMSDYWHRPTELFARAFECATFDLLNEKNVTSPYLVHSLLESDLKKLEDLNIINPYPIEEERKKINKHMVHLMNEVKNILNKKNEIKYN